MAWALATLDHRDEEFMTALLQEACTKLDDFTVQVWRCGGVRVCLWRCSRRHVTSWGNCGVQLRKRGDVGCVHGCAAPGDVRQAGGFHRAGVEAWRHGAFMASMSSVSFPQH